MLRFKMGVKQADLTSRSISDLGWNLVMDDSSDDPIGFHLAKLLDKHLLGNCGNRSFQL
jgi:hypothetical protein